MADDIRLSIDLETRGVVPGDDIRGVARWTASGPLQAIEVRLAWHTEGKGSSDSGVALEDRLDNPPLVGSHAFALPAPEGPYSFSGKLVSLVWQVGLRAIPSGEVAWEEVVISPTGREIRLQREPGSDAAADAGA